MSSLIDRLEGKGASGSLVDRLPREVPKADPSGLGPGTLSIAGFDTGIETPEWLDETLAGAGRRLSEIGTLGMHEAEPEAAERLDDSGYALAGSVVADIGSLALGGNALKAAGALPKVGKALSAAGNAIVTPQTATQAIVGGGAYGAATSKDRLAGATGGAVGGGIGHAGAKVAGKVVAPKVRSSASDMIDAGGNPTLGEMLGGGFQKAEDAATSVPFVGDMIHSAKADSLRNWGRGIVLESLQPIKKTLPKGVVGREAIEQANDLISAEYDSILSGLKVRLDPEFSGMVSKLKDMASHMPKKHARLFVDMVDENVTEPFENGNGLLLGETFKEVDSTLRTAYKNMLSSKNPYRQKVGKALREVHNALLDMAKRQNVKAAGRLQKADQAYAKISRVNDAASYAGAREGIFTPAQLKAAAKKRTSNRQWAQGKGFDQKAIEEAQDMLAQSVPDSGTARRLLNTLFFGGAGYMEPNILVGGLAGAAAYTKPGRVAAKYAIGKRPQMAESLRLALEELAAPVGVVSAAGGVNVNQ